MEIRILPGSPFLQACFYGLAAVIVIAAAVLVRSASLRSGDSPSDASRLQRRFAAGAIVWMTAVSAASFAGLLVGANELFGKELRHRHRHNRAGARHRDAGDTRAAMDGRALAQPSRSIQAGSSM